MKIFCYVCANLFFSVQVKPHKNHFNQDGLKWLFSDNGKLSIASQSLKQSLFL